MTRDMELVRTILLAVRSRTDLDPAPVEIAGADETLVGRHVEMLHHEGLIEGVRFDSMAAAYARIDVTDLSWSGHDFLSVLENDTVWSRLKQKLSPAELATLPLSVIMDAGVGLLKVYTRQALGLND